MQTAHNDLREEISAKYQNLLQRLARIEGHLQHTDKPLSPDFEEQAVERENDQVLEALDESTRLELQRLQHTLEAIDQGTYGICRVCDDPIAPRRLQALPTTTTCIQCANELESA